MELHLVQYTEPLNPMCQIRILVVEDFAAWEKRMEENGRYIVYHEKLTADRAAELQSRYKPLISR